VGDPGVAEAREDAALDRKPACNRLIVGIAQVQELERHPDAPAPQTEAA